MEEVQKEMERIVTEKMLLDQEKRKLQNEKLKLLKKGPEPIPKWTHWLMGGSILLFVCSILGSATVTLVDKLITPILTTLPVNPFMVIGASLGIATCSTIVTLGMEGKKERQFQQAISDNQTKIKELDTKLIKKELEYNNLVTRYNQRNQTPANCIKPIKNYPSDQATKTNGRSKQKM